MSYVAVLMFYQANRHVQPKPPAHSDRSLEVISIYSEEGKTHGHCANWDSETERLKITIYATPERL